MHIAIILGLLLGIIMLCVAGALATKRDELHKAYVWTVGGLVLVLGVLVLS